MKTSAMIVPAAANSKYRTMLADTDLWGQRLYFAIPGPYELEAFRADGLAGTLPCEARACSLSLSARVFRSLFRPLSNRSENSRGSIEESKLVSGEGFDHRLQARRIKRKITRRFLISRPTQKPPSAQ